jgi:soluble lytic murein transglycosylase
LVTNYPRLAAGVGVFALLAGVAFAQTLSPSPAPAPVPVEPPATLPAGPMPYSGAATPRPRPAPMSDVSALQEALRAARANDYDRASTMQTAIQDPVARKIVTWALVDIAEDKLGYFRLDNARRDLWGWPREERRWAAAERGIETSALGPQQTIAWFGEQEPVSPAGAMALAGARRALGQTDAAASMVRHWCGPSPCRLAPRARCRRASVRCFGLRMSLRGSRCSPTSRPVGPTAASA